MTATVQLTHFENKRLPPPQSYIQSRPLGYFRVFITAVVELKHLP
jgi:hypothetical protein